MSDYCDRFVSELNYGCWGQIGNIDIPGKGEPLDDIDRAYRNWQYCRSCAGIDSGGDCAIDQTPYEIGFEPATQRIDCDSNKTPCATQLCRKVKN